MTQVREPLHPLFRLLALAAGIFIITVFAMVATVFGDQQSPVAQFLDEHGGTLIFVEVVATLALGFAAMSADRRQSRRALEERYFRNGEPPSDETPDAELRAQLPKEGNGLSDSETN